MNVFIKSQVSDFYNNHTHFNHLITFISFYFKKEDVADCMDNNL